MVSLRRFQSGSKFQLNEFLWNVLQYVALCSIGQEWPNRVFEVICNWYFWTGFQCVNYVAYSAINSDKTCSRRKFLKYWSLATLSRLLFAFHWNAMNSNLMAWQRWQRRRRCRRCEALNVMDKRCLCHRIRTNEKRASASLCQRFVPFHECRSKRVIVRRTFCIICVVDKDKHRQ